LLRECYVLQSLKPCYHPPNSLSGVPLPIYGVLVLLAVAEVLFFPYYYQLFKRLQLPNDHLKHFAENKAMRQALVVQCFDAILAAARSSTKGSPAPEVVIRQVCLCLCLCLCLRLSVCCLSSCFMFLHFGSLVADFVTCQMLEGWFLDVPLIKIHFGNIAQWSAWAFFGKDVKEMNHVDVEENNDIVRYIETLAQWRFPPGFANDVHALRLDLDPLFATQRPFIFYLCVVSMNYLFHRVVVKGLLHFRFFKHPSVHACPSQHVYYRKARVVSESTTPKLPVVFIHGIGVGFIHYLGILLMLPEDVDVFLVEWPGVSMQMSTLVPTAETSCVHLEQVLHAFHHDKAVFVAHSLGTVCVSWMLRSSHGAHASLVAHSVLLDPIGFLLFLPKVAAVFVYLDPHDWIELLMHFFLSREIFISYALSRQFSWSHNAIFIEDLVGHRPPSRTSSDGDGQPNFEHTVRAVHLQCLMYWFCCCC
jgi:pimeloyl-ACP methyl ester carboxylesterase